MGFAIAEHLASRGNHVTLVCGPVQLKVNNPLIERIDVTSAEQMYEACIQHFTDCDGAIMTAAVADYAPLNPGKEKIKRSDGNLSLELTPNKDIAAELGRIKRRDQVLVGFALETSNEIDNALLKLKKKNLDMIVLNSLREEGSGFGYDTNKVTIITRDESVYLNDLKSKNEVAKDIINKMLDLDNSAND
jgi:phosphopantothenoylcysteine decarboxylase / phosphopantothenate---cysteine ligase